MHVYTHVDTHVDAQPTMRVANTKNKVHKPAADHPAEGAATFDARPHYFLIIIIIIVTFIIIIIIIIIIIMIVMIIMIIMIMLFMIMIIIFYYYDYDYYLLLLLSLFLLSLSLSLSLLLFIIIMIIIIITIIMIIIIIITVGPHYDPGTAPSRTVPASSYGTIEGARHRRRPIRLGAVLRNHDAAARRSRRSAYACSASICCAPPHERACMRPPAFARRKPRCVPEPVVAVETFTCSSVGQSVCRPLNTLQNCGQGMMTRTMQCTSSTRGQVPVYIGSMSALSRHLRAYGRVGTQK